MIHWRIYIMFRLYFAHLFTVRVFELHWLLAILLYRPIWLHTRLLTIVFVRRSHQLLSLDYFQVRSNCIANIVLECKIASPGFQTQVRINLPKNEMDFCTSQQSYKNVCFLVFFFGFIITFSFVFKLLELYLLRDYDPNEEIDCVEISIKSSSAPEIVEMNYTGFQ